MKLNLQTKHRKHAGPWGQGRRFYTTLDMSVLKHDIAVVNAQRKRGELPNNSNQYICCCGCGVEGCFIHGSSETTKRNGNV